MKSRVREGARVQQGILQGARIRGIFKSNSLSRENEVRFKTSCLVEMQEGQELKLKGRGG